MLPLQQIQPSITIRGQLFQQRQNAGDGFSRSGKDTSAFYGEDRFAAAGVGEGAVAADADDSVSLHHYLRAAGVGVAGVGVRVEAQNGEQCLSGNGVFRHRQLGQLRKRVRKQGKGGQMLAVSAEILKGKGGDAQFKMVQNFR